MKTWVKKSIVIMVAFLTFGLITPTHEIWEAFDQNPSNRASIGPSSGTSTALGAEHEDSGDGGYRYKRKRLIIMPYLWMRLENNRT